LLHALVGLGGICECGRNGAGGQPTNKSGIILTKRQSYSLYPHPAAAALPVYFPLVTQRPKQEQIPREQQGEGRGDYLPSDTNLWALCPHVNALLKKQNEETVSVILMCCSCFSLTARVIFYATL
jgi:hypothetical protein